MNLDELREIVVATPSDQEVLVVESDPEGGPYAKAVCFPIAEVPFKVFNGHIYLQVRINGKGPLLMLFDSGGANILESRVARQLGLKPEGALGGSGVGESKQDVGLAKVDTIEIGGIVVKAQIFATLDLGDVRTRPQQ